MRIFKTLFTRFGVPCLALAGLGLSPQAQAGTQVYSELVSTGNRPALNSELYLRWTGGGCLRPFAQAGALDLTEGRTRGYVGAGVRWTPSIFEIRPELRYLVFSDRGADAILEARLLGVISFWQQNASVFVDFYSEAVVRSPGDGQGTWTFEPKIGARLLDAGVKFDVYGVPFLALDSTRAPATNRIEGRAGVRGAVAEGPAQGLSMMLELTAGASFGYSQSFGSVPAAKGARILLIYGRDFD